MSASTVMARDIFVRIRRIERALRIAGISLTGPATRAITSWEDMDLPLFSGWVPYGSGYGPPGFYKDHGGVVHLRGAMKNGAVGPLFQMDAGFWPGERVATQCLGGGMAPVRIDVTVGGMIMVVGVMDSSFVSLDGIRWRAES